MAQARGIEELCRRADLAFPAFVAQDFIAVLQECGRLSGDSQALAESMAVSFSDNSSLPYSRIATQTIRSMRNGLLPQTAWSVSMEQFRRSSVYTRALEEQRLFEAERRLTASSQPVGTESNATLVSPQIGFLLLPLPPLQIVRCSPASSLLPPPPHPPRLSQR